MDDRAPYPIMMTAGPAGPVFNARGYLRVRAMARPRESIVSLAWRFATINTLTDAEAMTVLAPDINPFEGVEPRSEQLNVTTLARALGVPRRAIERGLLDGKCDLIDGLRYCRKCLRRHAFHSMLYQRSTTTHCPVHAEPLADTCHRCGHSIPIRFGAQLFVRPYRCGYCRGHFTPPARQWQARHWSRQEMDRMVRVRF